MNRKIPGLDYVSLERSKILMEFGYQGTGDLVIAGTTQHYDYPLRSETEQGEILCETVYMAHHLYTALGKYTEMELNGKAYELTPSWEDNAPTDFVGYKEKGGLTFLYREEGLKTERLAKLVLRLHKEGLIKP